jgi:hypothetical protein
LHPVNVAENELLPIRGFEVHCQPHSGSQLNQHDGFSLKFELQASETLFIYNFFVSKINHLCIGRCQLLTELVSFPVVDEDVVAPKCFQIKVIQFKSTINFYSCLAFYR